MSKMVIKLAGAQNDYKLAKETLRAKPKKSGKQIRYLLLSKKK